MSASNPPVVVLGGSANALSVTRSLGRLGVEVAVAAARGCPAFDSRYCAVRHAFADKADASEFWDELLLGGHRALGGSVLLACDDDAVAFLAEQHEMLSHDYIMDGSDPAVQLAMLDKQRSLELAHEAGVGAPRFWRVDELEQIAEVVDEVEYPALVKPLHSHLFQRAFGGQRYFRAANPHELRDGIARAVERGLAVMATELIPGPDSQLGSYYTYVDAAGEPLFHFTKKIIRRFPRNEGLASYHVTEWDEEIAAEGRRFFEYVGYRGLGNVEFKRDPRDGRLKLIECNPRFTAAQELLVRAGLDAAVVTYRYVTGGEVPVIDRYTEQLHLWAPVRDLRAFLQLRAAGELSLGGWLGGLGAPRVYPFLRSDDPRPSLLRGLRRLDRRR